MPWNFWREAHDTVFGDLVTAVRPRSTKRYVGVVAGVGVTCAVTLALQLYSVPGRLTLTLLLDGSVLALLPAAYVFEMLKYPANLASRLKGDVKELRSRLHSRDIAESSIIALIEHLSEMKFLQGERVRNPEQYANWVSRYQMLIQATYIILSKGVSNNVAMSYVSLPVVKVRYISGCFNDDHMKAMFSLEKYVDKLQCIIDGHFLTSQHARANPKAPREDAALNHESYMSAAA